MRSVSMLKSPRKWKDGNSCEISFSVTEECNLRCKYCYMIHKGIGRKMDLEVAKKCVDYLLENHSKIFLKPAVMWDFIGGEPLLEIELIDQIADYIKQRLYLTDHPWFNNFRFGMSSNGLLYSSDRVQQFIQKNHEILWIGLSIDGNKEKHDLQRKKADGTGSYNDVIKNVKLWQKQFPNASTKATFSHDDLPFLKDSVIHLWKIGIRDVMANLVFEDVWEEGDDAILEEQLIQLADHMIENDLWKEHRVAFFNENMGFPYTKNDLLRNWCGTGHNMMTIDYKGNFYPCVRFLDFTFHNNDSNRCLGNYKTGIDFDRLRPFRVLTTKSQISLECTNCEVATGCAWCTGNNFENSSMDTIYSRATYNCKMHKATVRASEYFWKKWEQNTNDISPRSITLLNNNKTPKFLTIIASSTALPICNYTTVGFSTTDDCCESILQPGLEYARLNNYTPIIVDEKHVKCPDINSSIEVVDMYSVDIKTECIALRVKIHELCMIYQCISKLPNHINRINLVFENLELWTEDEVGQYSEQLAHLSDLILEKRQNLIHFSINVITDVLDNITPCDCNAGINNICLAPNGKFYPCPAFYYNLPNFFIGELPHGLTNNVIDICKREASPLCSLCSLTSCKRCIYMNKIRTRELVVPSRVQCLIGFAEYQASKQLQSKLEKVGITCNNYIIDSPDPLVKFAHMEQHG